MNNNKDKKIIKLEDRRKSKKRKGVMSKTKKGDQSETIKIKNSYFEMILGIRLPDGSQNMSRNFQSLMDKNVFPEEYKPRYWLGRAFDKLLQEMKVFLDARQRLIKQYTKKRDSDGQIRDPKNGVITKWKKGDPISLPNGTPDWEDFESFTKEFNELREIEIDLGIQRIEFDPEKGPDATPGEQQILIPLLKEPTT